MVYIEASEIISYFMLMSFVLKEIVEVVESNHKKTKRKKNVVSDKSCMIHPLVT